MKTIIYFCLLSVFICLSIPASSQRGRDLIFKKLPQDWSHRSFETDSIYGAAIHKAHEYLQGRTPARIIVAILDGGGDVTHEDLKNSLWTNRGEIPGNGIDDDKNGFVDDIHGWNFLGYPNREQVQSNSFEADREFIRLKEKYLDTDTTRFSKKEIIEYAYFKEICKKSSLYRNDFRSIKKARIAQKYIYEFLYEFEARYPEQEFDLKALRDLETLFTDTSEMHRSFHYMINIARYCTKRELAAKKFEEMAKSQYDKSFRTAVTRTNDRLKADPLIYSLKKRNHGNGNLLGKNADHALHVAGIVGATRNNNLGMDGVADIELMLVRVSAGWGDEWDKDVASAIYYAVDNGAKVINMSFGKSISPQQELVFKAMLYAEKKGVLLVHGAGNGGLCNDETNFYPIKRVSAHRTLTNMMNIGASTPKGEPCDFSHYGKKGVDLFAPGDEIYSLAPNNGYSIKGGTSMASPLVAGIAAFVWSYFPDFTAPEIRDILIQSVTSRKGVMVHKPMISSSFEKKGELVDFGELSEAGGIVNAYNAVVLADQIQNKKQNKK